MVGNILPSKGKDPKTLKKRAEATALYHQTKIMKTIALLTEQYENLMEEKK
jgi:hypothetical protein